MKTLILILAVILATGCATNKCKTLESWNKDRIIYAVDYDFNVAEDPNNPGTFYYSNDTTFIQIKEWYDRKGNYKSSYKILNK